MDTTIAVISELISSIALVGVVITLLLESRQLRTSQIQTSRTFHVELIRLGLDYPAVASVIGPEVSSEDYQKYAFLGLLLESWELDYELKTMSAKAIQAQARAMFKSDYARTWWAGVARTAWNDAAAAKSEKEFFALVDGEFSATRSHTPGRDLDDKTNEPRAE